MNLSKNFTLRELIKSNTATEQGIDNNPNDEELRELKKLCQTVLQPLRDAWGKPLIVTSGFRCYVLNKAVGGVPTSQHTYGQAADIVTSSVEENAKLFELAKKMIRDDKTLNVGQLIFEQGKVKDGVCRWIHISTPTNRLNNQIFIA